MAGGLREEREAPFHPGQPGGEDRADRHVGVGCLVEAFDLEIAARAGVARPTVYTPFTGTAALLIAIPDRWRPELSSAAGLRGWAVTCSSRVRPVASAWIP